jgi:ferredoxin
MTDVKTRAAVVVEVLSLTNESVVIRFQRVRKEVLAALRVIMLSQIPALAIDEVVVERNTTATADDDWIERVSLLPLDSRQVDEALVELCYACAGVGCSACAVAYTLDIHNPGGSANSNSNDEKGVVGATYSEVRVTQLDLKPKRLGRAEGKSMDPQPSSKRKRGAGAVLVDLPLPVQLEGDDPMVLGMVGPRQRIRLSATAHVGTQVRHARWAVCGPVGFRTPVDILLNNEALASKSPAQLAALVAICPPKVFALQPPTATDGKDSTATPSSGRLVVTDANRCIQCNKCTTLTDSDEWRPTLQSPMALHVQPRADEEIMTLAAVGQLPPLGIYTRAIDILHAQATDLFSQIMNF